MTTDRSDHKSSPTVGVALGSGGARGWAHVGVLRALLDHGIEPAVVSGASMGALVGGVYAAGTLDMLHQFALSMDWKEVLSYFVEFKIPRSGIIEGGRIVEFVRKHIREPRFDGLERPLQVVATDLFSGAEVVLSEGNVIDAVRASISIPGIFTPVPHGERWLVDGGLTNPVPVDRVRAMGATIVIAVDVTALHDGQSESGKEPPPPTFNDGASSISAHPLVVQLRRHSASMRNRWLPDAWRKHWLPDAWHEWWNRERDPSLFDVVGQSIRIMEARISAARLAVDVPDILLQPIVGDLHFMDFHRAPEAIAAGYAATLQRMDAIRNLIESG